MRSQISSRGHNGRKMESTLPATLYDVMRDEGVNEHTYKIFPFFFFYFVFFFFFFLFFFLLLFFFKWRLALAH